MIPIRDGVKLATDIWRRAGTTWVPAVVVRFAVGKDHPEALTGSLLPNLKHAP